MWFWAEGELALEKMLWVSEQGCEVKLLVRCHTFLQPPSLQA